jgi:hypothetical protein
LLPQLGGQVLASNRHNGLLWKLAVTRRKQASPPRAMRTVHANANRYDFHHWLQLGHLTKTASLEGLTVVSLIINIHSGQLRNRSFPSSAIRSIFGASLGIF